MCIRVEMTFSLAPKVNRTGHYSYWTNTFWLSSVKTILLPKTLGASNAPRNQKRASRGSNFFPTACPSFKDKKISRLRGECNFSSH